jgi:hypothetical protein
VADVVARRHSAALVQAAVELHDDLAGAVVVDELELADVAVLHHQREKLDDHLARRPQQHLALAALLRVGERLERVREDADANHGVSLCSVGRSREKGMRMERGRGEGRRGRVVHLRGGGEESGGGLLGGSLLCLARSDTRTCKSRFSSQAPSSPRDDNSSHVHFAHSKEPFRGQGG